MYYLIDMEVVKFCAIMYRYGRQTLPGLIKDGMSALSRYYMNNFQDGIRQVCGILTAIFVLSCFSNTLV